MVWFDMVFAVNPVSGVVVSCLGCMLAVVTCERMGSSCAATVIKARHSRAQALQDTVHVAMHNVMHLTTTTTVGLHTCGCDQIVVIDATGCC